jgi:hypothetical protein
LYVAFSPQDVWELAEWLEIHAEYDRIGNRDPDSAMPKPEDRDDGTDDRRSGGMGCPMEQGKTHSSLAVHYCGCLYQTPGACCASLPGVSSKPINSGRINS